MKVPPKRKGNRAPPVVTGHSTALNESPSEKEGKFRENSEKRLGENPSMKVPPKRKGNGGIGCSCRPLGPLNESPSEKEGKSCP